MHPPSIHRSQAHLLHDGLVARFGVQEIKIWKVLNMRQPGFAFSIGLLQIVERLTFAFQGSVRNSKEHWGSMFRASVFLNVAQLPLQYRLEASPSVGLVDRNRRFLLATQLKTNFHFLGRLPLHALVPISVGKVSMRARIVRLGLGPQARFVERSIKPPG